jgi:hypothetical protein
MEEMFENNDIDTIRKLLDLPDNSNYESILGNLYHESKKTKQLALNQISKETLNNFKILGLIVNKRLSEKNNGT